MAVGDLEPDPVSAGSADLTVSVAESADPVTTPTYQYTVTVDWLEGMEPVELTGVAN